MPQLFGDIYQNVRDSVFADGRDERDDIQYAIGLSASPTLRTLLFPAGTYGFRGKLTFPNAYQKIEFLSGAILRPLDSTSYVQVGTDVGIFPDASYQTIVGMRIDVTAYDNPDSDGTTAAPIVLHCRRSASVVFKKLRVTSELPVTCMVKLEELTKCKMIGGLLRGPGNSGSTGLMIADNSNDGFDPEVSPAPDWSSEVSALRLTIDGFDNAVWLACVTITNSFVACAFLNSNLSAILVDGSASLSPPDTGVPCKNLNLRGCRFDGARHYIHVSKTGALNASQFSACTFGAFNPVGDDDDDGGTRSIIRAEDAPAVTLYGVRFVGCAHDAVVDPPRAAVWQVDASTLEQSTDAFNAWNGLPMASGGGSNHLATMTSDGGTLRLGGNTVALNADNIGFFDTDPTAQTAYPLTWTASDRKTNLRGDPVADVLRTLIYDLAQMGIVKQT